MDSKTLQTLRRDAEDICRSAIEASVPDAAIQRALAQLPPCQGRTVLVSIGKAGWQTAKAAYNALGSTIEQGVVVTKYGHSQGPIGDLAIYEAGHPVPDEHSVRATEAALAAVSGLCARDRVLFLVSGGGSALFERPLVPLAELEDITGQMLACGADITQINTIRKRLSGVKGGRFAQLCAPAHVYAILLSDVIGDPPDMIASGPAYPDSTTTAQAMALVSRYGLTLSPQALDLLEQEPPKVLDNVTMVITGSVAQLCRDAAARAEALGYRTCLLTDRLQCEAREAGRFLSAMAGTHAGKGEKTAYILGGETVVRLTGRGLGGRNQELALAAAEGLAGLEAVVASVGSDGGRAGRSGHFHRQNAGGQRRLSRPENLRRADRHRAYRHQCQRHHRAAGVTPSPADPPHISQRTPGVLVCTRTPGVSAAPRFDLQESLFRGGVQSS